MASMGRIVLFLAFAAPFLQFVSGYSATCTYYGDYNSLPISTITCSDHPPGLYTGPTGSNWGNNAQTLVRNVPQIHNGGNLYATAWNNVTGTGSSMCLNCLKITASNGKYVTVTVIDRKGAGGVDLSDAAWDCLYGAGSHVGGGSFTVDVQVVSNTPCSGGGSCGSGGTTPSTTTTKAPVTTTKAPTGGCKQYTVKSGDSGWGIAQANGLDFNTQLSPWNPSVNWNALQVGQVICISAPGSTPSTTKAPTSSPAPTTTKAPTSPPSGGCKKYTVKSGDSGWGIAQANGLDFNTQLSKWNPGVNWNALQIGQQLCISSPTAAAQTTTFEEQQSWLVPLIVVVAVLFVLTVIVLGYRRQSRSRGFSSELGVPDVPTGEKAKMVDAPQTTSPETAVLTQDLEKQASTEDVTPAPTSPVSPPYSELPAGWEKMADPNTGRQYYYNHSTGVTQWETPDS